MARVQHYSNRDVYTGHTGPFTHEPLKRQTQYTESGSPSVVRRSAYEDYARAYSAHRTIPSPQTLRYDPYTRHARSDTPHHASPRRRLVALEHPPEFAAPRYKTGSVPQKAYQTTKPTEKYQQSRGAQRDAKWHAKYEERAHLASHTQSQRQRQSPQPRQYHSRDLPTFKGTIPPPPSFHDRSGTLIPNGGRVRAEQQVAIAAARQSHLAARQEQARLEAERKKRRIQLQVFVHARSTHCAWEGCQAVLNSWALLEKHLLHAHLRPSIDIHASERSVQCKWGKCPELFASREDCLRHCLIGHMDPFSARCPFDCLFEGPHFDDLVAHIGRRHPHATPDDFVPGLIHHRPIRLPRSVSHLPTLPISCKISPFEEGVYVKPHPGDVSTKIKRLVESRCRSGRRPRKDDFADKVGASAAISAMVENSRRISLVVDARAGETKDSLSTGEEAPPQTASSIPVTAKEAVEMGVHLVDVGQSVRTAKDQARREAVGVLCVEEGSVEPPSSPSTRGSVRPLIKVKLEHAPLSNIRGGPQERSSSPTESETTASSRFSLYKGEDQQVWNAIEAEDGLKRSARLQRKQGCAEQPDSSPLEESDNMKKGKCN